MNNRFHPLRLRSLGRVYALHAVEPTSTLLLDDPASHLLVDFFARRPSGLNPHMSIPEARLRMEMADAALKLVENAAHEFLGVITFGDINSERPLGEASRRGIEATDIQVQDIMIPICDLPAVQYRDLLAATVGDLLSTFQDTHMPCLLVTDEVAEGGETGVRGLVAAADLADRLDIAIDLQRRATSFSEIVQAVQGRF